MKSLIVQTGVIIGKDHHVSIQPRNCQDAAAFSVITIEGIRYILAAVSDGCSGSRCSEVGAWMLAPYAVNEMALMLSGGIPVGEIPTMLFPRAEGYLRTLAGGVYFPGPNAARQMYEFMKERLTCTLLGMVMSPGEGRIFAAGDGQFALGGEFTVIDQANRPHYLAYRLFPRGAASPELVPDSFEVWSFNPQEYDSAALFTDGFKPELFPQLLGQKPPFGVQCKLNLWASKRGGRRFTDDVGCVLVEEDPEVGKEEGKK